MSEKLLKLSEGAKIANVGRQALYMAIKKGKLKVIKKGGRWFTTEEYIRSYQSNKYNGEERKLNGESVFDPSNGIYSINRAMHDFNEKYKNNQKNKQKIYHALRTGKLKGYRKGSSWIIMHQDAMNFWEGKDARQLEMLIS